MKRRAFILGLGSTFVATPHLTYAQQRTTPVIGFLGSASPQAWVERLKAFRQGLADVGYTEGQNVAAEYRWAEGRNERLPALAAELVQRKVAVIVVLGNTPSALAAKAATTTIPIFFRLASDPVSAGLVASLARPGGNATGVTTLGLELGPKKLEFLHELAPTAKIIALLTNPTNPSIAEQEAATIPAVAAKIGLQVRVLEASDPRGIEVALAEVARIGAGGLIISADAFFNAQSGQFAALAAQYRIPTMSSYREFTEAGGLASYGGNVNQAARQAGVYVGRILNGEKPSDLPVMRPTKLELVLNQKTANILGLTFPVTVLAQADEVIE